MKVKLSGPCLCGQATSIPALLAQGWLCRGSHGPFRRGHWTTMQGPSQTMPSTRPSKCHVESPGQVSHPLQPKQPRGTRRGGTATTAQGSLTGGLDVGPDLRKEEFGGHGRSQQRGRPATRAHRILFTARGHPSSVHPPRTPLHLPGGCAGPGLSPRSQDAEDLHRRKGTITHTTPRARSACVVPSNQGKGKNP